MFMRSLVRLRELEPELRLGWSVPRIKSRWAASPLVAVPGYGLLLYLRRRVVRAARAHLAAGRCDAVMSHYRLVTPALVKAVREEGGELYVWTVDDAAHIRRLERLGVTGVITNDPRLFNVDRRSRAVRPDDASARSGVRGPEGETPHPCSRAATSLGCRRRDSSRRLGVVVAPASRGAARARAGSAAGRCSLPATPGFAGVAHGYDERYDGRVPRAVLLAEGVGDVQAAVRWAARHGVRIAARSGGHSYAGYSTPAGGLVVDLRRMRRIARHHANTRVVAGPGVQLGDLYAALAPHGVTVPAGTCPSVALGGHAQGGGMGLAGRDLGLTCDRVEQLHGRHRRRPRPRGERRAARATCTGPAAAGAAATSGSSPRSPCARRRRAARRGSSCAGRGRRRRPRSPRGRASRPRRRRR